MAVLGVCPVPQAIVHDAASASSAIPLPNTFPVAFLAVATVCGLGSQVNEAKAPSVQTVVAVRGVCPVAPATVQMPVCMLDHATAAHACGHTAHRRHRARLVVKVNEARGNEAMAPKAT